jgi:hypothetical protein
MYKPGESGNLNGRPKGTSNKATTAIKEAYQNLLENNLDNMNRWLAIIADKDPKGAVELMLKLSEYILPKLARTEVAGHDGEDLFKNITFAFNIATNGKSQENTQETGTGEESENPS